MREKERERGREGERERERRGEEYQEVTVDNSCSISEPFFLSENDR